jgi:hypothetical protein
LETAKRIEEPEVDRWGEQFAASERSIESLGADLPFFRLSGGIMKSDARTSNRIDGLLTRMMEHPTAARYLANADKNLDYLFTSLQLDMINMVADDESARNEKVAVDRAREEDSVLESPRV